MLRLAALLGLLSSSALADTYLPQASLAACQARSAAQCVAMHCDGVLTKYWWPCEVLANAVTGSTTTIVIQPGTPFDATAANAVSGGPVGLSAGEQAAVKSRTVMGTALADIISTITFDGRVTAPQKTAIQAQFGAEWTAIQGAALVDFKNATIQKDLSDWLGAGIITQADYATITAPQAQIVSP